MIYPATNIPNVRTENGCIDSLKWPQFTVIETELTSASEAIDGKTSLPAFLGYLESRSLRHGRGYREPE